MTTILRSPVGRRGAAPPGTWQVRVRSMTWEAEDVLSLELTDAAGGELPAWEPGAHIDVQLPTGAERQYSLCGSCRGRSWTVAVLQVAVGRGGSRFVHTELRPGATLTVRGPSNNFPLVDAAEYLFIAGGIGITPILPMISDVRRRGKSWRLLYGGRRRASMAFLDRLADLAAEEPGRIAVRPEDEAGLLDLDAALGASGDGAVVYACGPESLLAALELKCHERNVPLHVERFAAKPRTGSTQDATFEVECRRSGHVVTVEPGESIIDALRKTGLDPARSCLDGICGTCETAVLGGEPEHRDSIMSPDEHAAGETMMICVSRCRSARLVLDL